MLSKSEKRKEKYKKIFQQKTSRLRKIWGVSRQGNMFLMETDVAHQCTLCRTMGKQFQVTGY